MDFKATTQQYRRLINRYLRHALASQTKAAGLVRAMRYAVFPGGKRIRPLLMMAASDLLGIRPDDILPAACGVELIHNFSLIHDDLPCMDNDDMRRGKPSCHRKFGQATALLAGDALLALGLGEIAACAGEKAVIRAAQALGPDGMAGGQYLDIIYSGKSISGATKRWINRKKTGELFSLCFEIPAIKAGLRSKRSRILINIGQVFGEAFQVIDDMKDSEGDRKQQKKMLEHLRRKFERGLSSISRQETFLGFLARSIFSSFE
jgi:geranylgeranyl diphosphate synthase type II